MDARSWCLAGLWVATLLLPACHSTTPSAPCPGPVCSYDLVVRRARTMTYSKGSNTFNVGMNGTQLQVLETSYRHELIYDEVGTFVNASDVITADGYSRDITTINNEFPGPEIHVIMGAQVSIRVHNNLMLEAITVHFHGITMRGSPWMDGGAYVTQCPILPLQSFTYTFTAEPVGTHWYHSHMLSQHVDGLYGLMVVHDRPPTLPQLSLFLSDWFHFSGETMQVINPYGKYTRGTGELMQQPPDRDFAVDNNELTALQFASALINGRGRYLPNETLPLTTYHVTSGQRYRYRVVSAAIEFQFEVSVDQHQLSVVASDGNEYRAISVDSFMVHPGETLDFELLADQGGTGASSFWVRARTLRYKTGLNSPPDGIVNEVLAILSYDTAEGTDVADPETAPHNCTTTEPCQVFNCPFAGYPDSFNKHCIPIADARSMTFQGNLNEEYGLNTDPGDVEDLFFNFAMPIGSSINAHKFKDRRAPYSTSNSEEYQTQCDETECTTSGCMCTHTVRLTANKTYQFVLSDYRPDGIFMHHHIAHTHGHNFAVLAMGFPDYNATTGAWLQPNTDIICPAEQGNLCATPGWNGQRPALNMDSPPVKDTVVVPSRGYAIIRFRADNPGYWFFHCHQDLHFAEGMAMIIEEGVEYIPLPPPNFPSCEDFDLISSQVNTTTTPSMTSGQIITCLPSSTDSPTDLEGKVVMDLSVVIGVAFALLAAGALLSIGPLLCYMRWTARKATKD